MLFPFKKEKIKSEKGVLFFTIKAECFKVSAGCEFLGNKSRVRVREECVWKNTMLGNFDKCKVGYKKDRPSPGRYQIYFWTKEKNSITKKINHSVPYYRRHF